mgnify:CR=1 FL=1
MSKVRADNFTNRAGTNIMCDICDVSVKHPTRKDRFGNPIDSFHYTDKTGMKEAWDAHKAGQ